ncbi:PREDICTED: RNA polymerase II C-terminal domain phosphatase-like 4-like [Fragaria vesca subsp. vesca]
MSLATVSPIDNLVGCRKRSRGLVSDLGFIQDKTKRPKTETDLGIQQDARLAGDELSSVRFGYIRKGLGLSDDVINRLRNEITRNLLVKHKKLHLVLDLDHTLLNTTYIDKMSPEEEYLKADHSLQDVHIAGSQSQLMTKLRPHVRTFLEQASEMFELSISTMGSGGYALQMANLLDPANQMFGGSIISRSDGTVNKQKGLDVLLARPSAVVILDDKKQMWRNEDQANVIELPRYHFFRSSLQKYGLSDATPYSESKTDERDPLGRAYLATVLQVLKHIHNIFFNAVELDGCELIDRDVRPVLERVKKASRAASKIVFSPVIS